MCGLLLGWAAGTVGIHGIGLPAWQILLLLAAAVAALGGSRRNFAGLRPTRPDVWFVAFLSWCVFAEYHNSGSLHYYADYNSVIAPILFFLAYLVARAVVSTPDDFAKFVRGFALPAALNALLAMGQTVSPSVAGLVLRVAPSDGLDQRITGEKLIRATGLIGHWTGLGFYLCGALAGLCALMITRGRGHVPASTKLFATLILAGIICTLTFSVILTAIAILLATWITIGIRASQIVWLLAGASVLYLFFGNILSSRVTQQTVDRPTNALPSWVPNTINYRWRIWTDQTVPAIKERPGFGWGSNLYTSLSGERVQPIFLRWKSPESQWLFAAITFGVAAMVLLVIFLFSLLLATMQAARNGHAAARPVIALIIAVFLSAFTAPIVTNRGLPMVMFPLIGAALAAFHPARFGGARPSAPTPATRTVARGSRGRRVT